MEKRVKTALIIGAGTAGLSAAYSILKNTENIKPIVLESEEFLGGLARTIDYEGRKTDIGPHRFFSKDEEILKFWTHFLPLQGKPAKDDILLSRNIGFTEGISDPEITDKSMLKRKRFSRIYFKNKFFDYPVKINFRTVLNMGIFSTLLAGISYLKSYLLKRKENSLEDFFINRFGKILYNMFFENYTQKVWGRHPSKIDKSWGEQRVKGLSLAKTILNKLSFIKNKEISLIEEYYYPKKGAGQLWDTMANEILAMDGEILLGRKVKGFKLSDNAISAVVIEYEGKDYEVTCDYVISSMPIKDLVSGIDTAPLEIKALADKLPYRDYILVSLLIKDWNLKNNTDWRTIGNICPDSWIYVQDENVKVGRIYIPKNFSPYLSSGIDDLLIGMEYYCDENDSFWDLKDDELFKFAINELIKINAINDEKSVLKKYRINIKKAYPAYFDSYKDFDKIEKYLNSIENLYCIGRNGQHKYNNMDHSTASGILVAKVIKENLDKSVLWKINTENKYQETCS